jgi:two-component system sensor histidine kinase KdpD
MPTREACRPDPEELLRQIQAQEANEGRGRLKIFLGYAPRVGKSVRLFDEGRRRKNRGQDVIVGAVQVKGSEAIAELIKQFEVIGPPLSVEAIIERAPHVCLIDELARDNPPGSKYPHRWQEVEELRKHGITVVGAINLQHIYEENPAAPESVPLSFVQSADDIVIVDVPPTDPRQLSELRERALLLAAQVVETQLQAYMDVHGIVQSWGTQERILVCITPRSSAKAMLESGARAADRFHGQLLVVYVKQPDLERAAEETLAENLEYARKLKADVHVIEGRDPIPSILAFAREHRITQVFVGHTGQSSWKFWKANNVDRLIHAAEGMDVRIFPRMEPVA